MAEPGDGQAVSGACHSVMGAGLCDECRDSAGPGAQGWPLANGLGFLGGESTGKTGKRRRMTFYQQPTLPATSSPGLSKPGC